MSRVNVKLAKCGSIRRALEMVHTARAHGMFGCMVDTSLGIAAAAQTSGLFDFANLLADDSCAGFVYGSGRIHLPESPDLGVESR